MSMELQRQYRNFLYTPPLASLNISILHNHDPCSKTKKPHRYINIGSMEDFIASPQVSH